MHYVSTLEQGLILLQKTPSLLTMLLEVHNNLLSTCSFYYYLVFTVLHDFLDWRVSTLLLSQMLLS